MPNPAHNGGVDAGFPWAAVGDIAGDVAGYLFSDGGPFGTNQNARNNEYANALNIYNSQRQDYWNSANIDLTRETNQQARDFALQMYNMQRDDASRSIQTRVADAQAAGIHPLYALNGGAAIATPAMPTFNVPSGTPERMEFAPSGGGTDVGAMGQNISRALASVLDKNARARQALHMRWEDSALNLDLDHKMLENRLLAAQIARLDRSQVGPPGVVSGDGGIADGSSARTTILPNSVTANEPGHSNMEAGSARDVGWLKTEKGYTISPSVDAQQRAQDFGIEPWAWSWRNRLLPMVGIDRQAPPKSWLPKGAKGWHYYDLTGEWRPTY